MLTPNKIEENLLPGQLPKDRTSSLKLKLDTLLKGLLKEDMLGFSQAQTYYVIDF